MTTRKVALITGASSDIGLAVSEMCLSKGVDIAAHAFKNSQNLERLRALADSHQTSLRQYQGDLAKHTNAQKLVGDVVKDFGRIDILINTVGPFYYRDIFSVTPDQWSEAINLNLNVNYFVTHYATEQLKKTKGHILFFGFSGSQSFKAWPMSADYCAAKAGITVLVKSLAARLAKEGVRVNAVCPGLIETKDTPTKERQDMANQVPLGRPGTTKEVAEVVKWVIFDSPEYMTGSFVSVAGGWEY